MSAQIDIFDSSSRPEYPQGFRYEANTFRLRRKVNEGWERMALIAEPRSAYLLRGSSRTEWSTAFRR